MVRIEVPNSLSSTNSNRIFFMSVNWQKPIIPWKRFWCPFGETIHIGEHAQGFLTDPESQFYKAYNQNLFTLDQLLGESCLILCGDPGMGKSTVIQQAQEALKKTLAEDGYLIFLDFRDLPTEAVFERRTVHSAEWRRWRSSTGTLVLVVDGVDEGLVKIPGFIGYLRSQLANEPLERLKLILVCRSAEWPVNEGRQLISLWRHAKEQQIYELCPLRQHDVEEAAEKWGLDRRAFIKNVYQQNVVGLAALPTTLFFLLDEFRHSGGFRGTHRELYERGCHRLAREIDPRRIEALRQLRKTTRVSTPQEIYETASRLAALVLLCGKSAIHTGPLDEANAHSDLHISEAADPVLTEDVILDTIASGLFTSRGPNRFGFAHQTFAECLAAQFLSRLPLVQIRSLLCARDTHGEHVVPQLAETAAWVAGGREDFFDYFCSVEPEVLLRSDISKIQNQRKAALVAAVLEKTKRTELFNDPHICRFFVTLRHPKLEAQLRPFIVDKSLDTVVRRMAMDIGGDCKVTDIADDLLRIVQDPGDSQHMRSHAAQALEELIPASRLKELIPFALGHAGTDPDDTIRGCAIRALVPKNWSVSQALPAIRAPRNTHFYGSYWTLLKYHLPRHLTESDLVPVLARMIRWTHCFDMLSWFEDLAGTAFAMAIRNLDKPQIRRLAVRVWKVKQLHYHPLPNTNESPVIKLFATDDNLRRAFIAALIDDSSKPSDLHCSHSYGSIFHASDLEWALNHISHLPVERRPAWANVIWGASRPETASLCWDLLLQRIEQIVELKTMFEWLRAWNLDEPMARKAKARWLREQRWKRKLKATKRDLDIEGMIRAALADISAGKTFRWLHLCDLLSCEKNQTTIWRPRDHDLIEFPGWKAADESRRSEIRSAARSFLLNHRDGYAEIGEPTNYFDPGYIAIWLLRDDVRNDDELKSSVATNWIEGLLGHFNNGSDHYQETAALAYELNPEVTLRVFIRETKKDDEQHGENFCRFGFLKTWNSRFTTATLDLIREGILKRGSVESLLTFLGPIAPAEAAACARDLLTPAMVANPNLRDQTIAILTSCIGGMPAATWDFAWPIIESDSEIAKRVLLRVADRFDHDRKKFLPTLTESQLGAFYLKLHTLFPPETDPPHNRGFSGVSSRQAVSWFRNDVINTLEAHGTEEACSELLHLAAILPKHAVSFRWRHYNARTSKRRLSWTPPNPQTMLALAKSNEGRLVRDADDLLEVVTEALGRYQTQLTRSTLPRSEVLWRYEGADTRQRNFEPHDEAFLSNDIARWLRDDLNQRGVVIGREVQPRRGQRTDIYVEAISRADSETRLDTVSVVIEVKGCWNIDVRSAADSQLVSDYLRSNGLTHGIYLVGWFVCDAWEKCSNKLNSETLTMARQEIDQLVSAYDGKNNPERVNGIVLDCSHSGSKAK
jgi:hypothetical protein